MSVFKLLGKEVAEIITKLVSEESNISNHLLSIKKKKRQLEEITKGSSSPEAQSVMTFIDDAEKKAESALTCIHEANMVLNAWLSGNSGSSTGTPSTKSTSQTDSSQNSDDSFIEYSDGNGLMEKALECKKGEYHYAVGDNNAMYAYGQLKVVPKDERKRDPLAQRQAGGDLREEDDDGGHLIAAMYGGDPRFVFPQNRNLNRGAYKELEKHWTDLLSKGCQVFVAVSVMAANDDMRQDVIMVSYKVVYPDGTEDIQHESFSNMSAKEQQEHLEQLTDGIDETDYSEDYAYAMSEENYDEDYYNETGIKRPKWGENAVNADKNGFSKDTPPKETTLKAGTVLGRYCSSFGRFSTEPGTPYERLSMPFIKGTVPYHEYRLIKDISCLKGIAAPDFGMPGGGTQLLFENTFADMIKQGIVERIR